MNQEKEKQSSEHKSNINSNKNCQKKLSEEQI